MLNNSCIGAYTNVVFFDIYCGNDKYTIEFDFYSVSLRIRKNDNILAQTNLSNAARCITRETASLDSVEAFYVTSNDQYELSFVKAGSGHGRTLRLYPDGTVNCYNG